METYQDYIHTQMTSRGSVGIAAFTGDLDAVARDYDLNAASSLIKLPQIASSDARYMARPISALRTHIILHYREGGGLITALAIEGLENIVSTVISEFFQFTSALPYPLLDEEVKAYLDLPNRKMET